MTDPPPNRWPAPTGPPVGATFGPGYGPPSGPAAGTEPSGPGRAGYAIGALVIVVGSFVAVVWFLIALVGTADPNYPSVPVPGDRQVELAAKPYTLFDDYPESATPTGRTPTVRITGPNGDETISPTEWQDTYITTTGRQGTGFATIRPTVAGVYRVQVLSDAASVSGPDGERVTIGEPDPMTGAVLAMLLGAVTFFAGLAVVLTTAVRRWRWRARRPAAP